VLKKAGIVVAAAAAGLLALSPLAFAGDKGDHDHGGVMPPAPVTQVENTTSRSPECTFDAQADNSVTQDAEGGDSLLGGVAGLAANTAAPVNGQTQAPVGSCNNIEDLVDVNVEDNFQDNDEETSTVEDSNNVEG
jgi:hypothetical protein